MQTYRSKKAETRANTRANKLVSSFFMLSFSVYICALKPALSTFFIISSMETSLSSNSMVSFPVLKFTSLKLTPFIFLVTLSTDEEQAAQLMPSTTKTFFISPPNAVIIPINNINLIYLNIKLFYAIKALLISLYSDIIVLINKA